jgi:hypothetical protein
VAGRVSADTRGNEWVTTAGVAIASSKLDAVRSAIPDKCPKWRNSDPEIVDALADLLMSRSLAVGAHHVNKATKEWRAIWAQEKSFQELIQLDGGPEAGFAKPANILKFLLFVYAHSAAIAQVIKTAPIGGFVDSQGLALISSDVICDSDIQGEENVELFRSLFLGLSSRPSRLKQFGVRLLISNVDVKTEEEEPLLLLADYAAGIAHASILQENDRLRLPIPIARAAGLIEAFSARNKLARASTPFDHSYKEIFGVLADLAQSLKLSTVRPTT